jgi:chorismate mutase
MVEGRMRAIRGATTVPANTVEAMQEAVTELLDELETLNHLHPSDIISATFSITRDLDAIFPGAIARQRHSWDLVPMIDVQQMHVEGSLQHCIRFLIHTYLPGTTNQICHPYLRGAKILRPDWSMPQAIANL